MKIEKKENKLSPPLLSLTRKLLDFKVWKKSFYKQNCSEAIADLEV